MPLFCRLSEDLKFLNRGYIELPKGNPGLATCRQDFQDSCQSRSATSIEKKPSAITEHA